MRLTLLALATALAITLLPSIAVHANVNDRGVVTVEHIPAGEEDGFPWGVAGLGGVLALLGVGRLIRNRRPQTAG